MGCDSYFYDSFSFNLQSFLFFCESFASRVQRQGSAPGTLTTSGTPTIGLGNRIAAPAQAYRCERAKLFEQVTEELPTNLKNLGGETWLRREMEKPILRYIPLPLVEVLVTI